MRGKLLSLVPRLLIVALAVALAAGLFAVSAQSGELDSATAPSSGWTTMAVGQHAWYAFNYPGDGSEIRIRMSVSPKDSARFSVWAAGDARAWVNGGAEKPIGRGTVNSAMGGDLNWVGRITIQGTYYVYVEQTGSNVANYQIDISGNSVTFPIVAAATVAPTRTPTVVATVAAEETDATGSGSKVAAEGTPAADATVTVTATSTRAKATTTAAATRATARAKATATARATVAPVKTVTAEATADDEEFGGETATDATPLATVELSAGVVAPPALPIAGTTPANALAIDGIPTSLAVGGHRWYAFSSSGDNEEILITLSATPKGSAAFSVWAAGEAVAYADGENESPVGRGSVNTALGGDLTWAGKFSIRGTYYVLVEQTGDATSFYTIEISGPGAN